MQHPQYAQLASRLGVARRAYKRMTVLAGAIVFVIESLGTIAIVIAADVMFDLAVAGRIGLFLIGAAALVYFAIRHILKPLTRPISDQQLALYLEQRNPAFEGALIAATEFGPGNYTGRVAQIVESILDQAVARAGKFDLRKAVDLGRLRKYALVAGVLVLLYGTAAVTMPQAVGRRFARVFTPWKQPPAEVVPGQKPPVIEAPLTLLLASGNSSLVRSGTLQLQATASRSPHEPLSFHFRSAAPGADSSWKMLPMSEIEKVHTFQLTLPDVNEDLEYFVAAENVKSEPHRVTVFDPLLIKSYEITTHYPAYLKFPDRTDKSDSADIAVPQGSTVTLRVTANGALTSGKVLWDAGQPMNAAVDPKDPNSALATMEAKANGTFKLSLTDTHGQTIESPTAASMTAVVDAPPTIKLTTPTESVNANPLSEILFAAEAADDLALQNASLVVTRGTDPTATPIKVPLTFDAKSNGDEHITATSVRGVLMLETIQPAPAVGESLSCYVEVTDRKGQVTPSDLIQIVIVPFESWAAYGVEKGGGAHSVFSLPPTLQAAWRLNAQAAVLAPNDLNRQFEELSRTMVDDGRVIHPYFDPMGVSPEKIVHGKKAMELAQAGHDSLVKHDGPAAVAQLRAAVAELALAGVLDVVIVSKPPESQNTPPTAAQMENSVAKLATLMEEKPQGSASKQARSEKDEAADTNKQTAETEQLETEQKAVTEKIKQVAVGAAPKGADKTAEEQDKLAKKTEAAAKEMKGAAGASPAKKDAADALKNAAEAMKAAVDALNKGDKGAAAQKAEAAGRHLADAKGALKTGSQDAVNATISKAQAIADGMAAKQADLLDKTGQAGKAAPKDKKAQAGALGNEQIKLTADAKALAEAVDALAKSGEGGGLKPDTNQHVQDAKTQLKKSRLEKAIGNAALLLAAGDTAVAAKEQTKVKDAAEAIGKSLAAAGGTRATDLAGALRQAKNAAAQAKADLADAKAAAGADSKKGTAKKAAESVAGLSKQLDQRDLADGNKEFAAAAAALKKAAEQPAKLTDTLAAEPAKIGDLEKITSALQTHLEAEYQATLKAQELFAAQREDCPPQYRPLVNRYFESISTNGQ